jgi:acyl carrier protein
MIEQEDRLIRCFSSVFPELTHEEICASSAESTGTWDSLSHVTLAALVEEEFGIKIQPDVLPNLDSFQAFLEYLQRSHIPAQS